jgi:hypothetical protein
LNEKKRCVNECPPGNYAKDDFECKECMDHCLECEEKDKCLTCDKNEGFYLYRRDGKCYDDEKEGYFMDEEENHYKKCP